MSIFEQALASLESFDNGVIPTEEIGLGDDIIAEQTNDLANEVEVINANLDNETSTLETLINVRDEVIENKISEESLAVINKLIRRNNGLYEVSAESMGSREFLRSETVVGLENFISKAASSVGKFIADLYDRFISFLVSLFSNNKKKIEELENIKDGIKGKNGNSIGSTNESVETSLKSLLVGATTIDAPTILKRIENHKKIKTDSIMFINQVGEIFEEFAKPEVDDSKALAVIGQHLPEAKSTEQIESEREVKTLSQFRVFGGKDNDLFRGAKGSLILVIDNNDGNANLRVVESKGKPLEGEPTMGEIRANDGVKILDGCIELMESSKAYVKELKQVAKEAKQTVKDTEMSEGRDKDKFKTHKKFILGAIKKFTQLTINTTKHVVKLNNDAGYSLGTAMGGYFEVQGTSKIENDKNPKAIGHDQPKLEGGSKEVVA